MLNHSAKEREQASHAIRSTKNTTHNLHSRLSVSLRRRAQAVINDISIDPETRAVIRYGLETNDPSLAELVRRIDAGETIIESVDFSETDMILDDDSIEEKIEALAHMICRAGDEPGIKSAALLVLMATVENGIHPKALANTAKHLAFTRCGELNLYGMVDVQISMAESELFTASL